MTPEGCLAIGGHCWVDLSVDTFTNAAGSVTVKRQVCKHCNRVRKGTAREPWDWSE